MQGITETQDGAEVIENPMIILAQEYAKRLPNPDALTAPNSHTFTGLIKYINKNMAYSRDILADINILNNIWEQYTDLVYTYLQKPTIEEYALLIGIHRDTLYSWLKGECRSDDICVKLGSSRSDTVKKWQSECALGRYKGAASGNVGMIFLCKAVDGMVETAPVQVQNSAQQIRSSSELLEDMRKLNGNGAQLGIEGE